MKIIKRDGHIVDYCPEKIEIAIKKANKEVPEEERVSDIQIKNIIKYIEGLKKRRMLVEDIQDIIEMRLMALNKFALAKEYITYRYTRALVRKSNTTDESILSLIRNSNKELADSGTLTEKTMISFDDPDRMAQLQSVCALLIAQKKNTENWQLYKKAAAVKNQSKLNIQKEEYEAAKNLAQRYLIKVSTTNNSAVARDAAKELLPQTQH